MTLPPLSLETPAAAWLALALPAILLLWILRPRRPRRRVPSVMLWPVSPAERHAARPWQRLRNHPLLWLQLVVAAILAAAAMRPFLPASAAGTHLVVLLDASGSMRAREGGAVRFDAARAAVRDLARGLGPGQRLTLVRLDDAPRVLVAESSTVEPVVAALEEQAPAFGPPDLAAAIALAATLTAGPAEWVLVSDGGRVVPEGARRPAGTAFRHLVVGAPAANVAVTGLRARRAGDRLALQAGLRATGTAPATGRLQLLADDQIVAAREWRLEPGAETQVTWTNLLVDAASRYEARLSGVAPETNALDHDDSAWAVVADPINPDVLLVSDRNTFLERILSVHGDLRPFRAVPADWPGLAVGARHALTILDGVWPEQWPNGSALVVGPSAGAAFRPAHVWPHAEHPLMRHVDWSDVRVASAYRLPTDAGWETLVDSDGGPLVAVRTDGGRRQAVLAFDLGHSDLPLRPAFPVLMANLLEWLVPRPEASSRAGAPGTSIGVSPFPLAEEVRVEGVDGVPEQLAPPWPPRPFSPPAPGLFQIVQEGPGVRQSQTLVVDGYHPAEAELTPRAVDLPAFDEAAAPEARDALALWPWLIAAVVVLSTLEWWVEARGR